MANHSRDLFVCTAQTPCHAAQHRAQYLRVLNQASAAQAMKEDSDKTDNIVQNIRAELDSVEADAKAPKQQKERIKSLLEKIAKLKLKVQNSPLICNVSSVATLRCAIVQGILGLDVQMCVRAAPLDC